jgi:hypothetical protein
VRGLSLSLASCLDPVQFNTNTTPHLTQHHITQKKHSWLWEAHNQNPLEMALVHQASVESEKENDAKRKMEALREEQLKTHGDVLGEEGFSQVCEKSVDGLWGVRVLNGLVQMERKTYQSHNHTTGSRPSSRGAPAWWPS